MKRSVRSQYSRPGEAVRQGRLKLGLSVNEVARRSGIDPAVVFRIESGEIVRPDPNKLARLAEVLGLSAADLYALTGYAAPSELPSFHPYLRAKYGQLPVAALEQLETYFDEVAEQYGAPSNGPTGGEDEQPE